MTNRETLQLEMGSEPSPAVGGPRAARAFLALVVGRESSDADEKGQRSDKLDPSCWQRASRFARDHLYLALAAALVFAAPLDASAQVFDGTTADLCECAARPSLGDFEVTGSVEAGTWPIGTTSSGSTVTLPLPPDGVLVFDSFSTEIPANPSRTIRFAKNRSNTPVTLLVKGNFSLASNVTLSLNGENGTQGSELGSGGQAGTGGPGGFAGGQGAHQQSLGTSIGGSGVGPGGGRGGAAPPNGNIFLTTDARGGDFAGRNLLLPLFGGAGGGGGGSSSIASHCAGGGGGGGGGAILVVANGTIDLRGSIRANGGVGGRASQVNVRPSCAEFGASGSGGAIRLVAQTLTGNGSLQVGSDNARSGNDQGRQGSPGMVRLEASLNDASLYSVSAVSATPTVTRGFAGPIRFPIPSTGVIAEIQGLAAPPEPAGSSGAVDIVTASGPLQILLKTENVPSGTTLELDFKPQAVTATNSVPAQRVAIDAASCTPSGACNTFAFVDLEPGRYIVEARATFEPPAVP